jgi:mRNA interferase YafQ
MYQLSTTNQFEKDYKLCKRRNYDMQLLHNIFLTLEVNGNLPSKNKPHKLTGNYKGFWECHIKPDWLLTWLQNDTTKQIEFVRTGTHADLF